MFGANDLRMVIRIAKGLEGDERIEHRRKDGSQAIGAFEAFEHPLLGFLERAFAKRMNLILSEPFGEFVDAVEPQEKVTPGESFRVGRDRQIALVDAFGEELVEVDVVFERAVTLPLYELMTPNEQCEVAARLCELEACNA